MVDKAALIAAEEAGDALLPEGVGISTAAWAAAIEAYQAHLAEQAPDDLVERVKAELTRALCGSTLSAEFDYEATARAVIAAMPAVPEQVQKLHCRECFKPLPKEITDSNDCPHCAEYDRTAAAPAQETEGEADG